MLKLLSRRRSPAALPVLPARPTSCDVAPRVACALTACGDGARATVLEVACGDGEACRLRALGLCEGAAVSIVRARDCTLLEVRGARLAVSHSLAAGITVLPVA